jgi:hypothetical protein
MKKILIASGVAVLAFASVAAAQTFSTNLTVGSTGADVAALQTWLNANGFTIPAIASGATTPGYFGAQTKAAVQKYQTSKGVPSTGFVGPLTRAALNGGASVATPAMGCPVGFTCTPVAGATTPVTGTPAVGITTVGIPGTLVSSLQSNYNGVTLDKAKSENVARIKLQANASDMQVTNLSLDFSVRLWLYVGTVTVKDDAGMVVASKTISGSDFSELTVGQKYRLNLPVNYVVPRATIKYLTVNVSALAVSDRDSGSIVISAGQIRSVDGTGVTSNDDIDFSIGSRTITYSGSGNANVVTTIDPTSPSEQLVQISTSVDTDNVLLAAYQLKSENTDSTLRTLKVYVHTTGANVNSVFNELKLKIAGTTYSADTVSVTSPDSAASSTVTFNNIDLRLPADQYVTVAVYGRVAKNVEAAASTTLAANSTNVVAEDSSYASVSVTNNSGISSEAQSFTASGVVATAPSVSYGTKTIENSGTTTQTFTFTASLKAGSNPIYISKNVSTALSTTSSSANVSVTNVDWSTSNTNGDGSTYFYIAPGQTKTFTATFNASAVSSSKSTVFQVTSVNAGTSSGSMATINLNSSDVQNALKAVLFH